MVVVINFVLMDAHRAAEKMNVNFYANICYHSPQTSPTCNFITLKIDKALISFEDQSVVSE